jgi:chemotaxis receptor (MCP) glutamine deamidase CheD
MFVDTGVVALLEELFNKGVRKENMKIWAVGGAHMYESDGLFEIGSKNVTMLRKILWKNGLLLSGEHLGDSCARTLRLNVHSGEVGLLVNGQPQEWS